MKTSLTRFIMLCCFNITVLSCSLQKPSSDEWVEGTTYAVAARTTWDSSERLSNLQSELVFIMDADAAISKLHKQGVNTYEIRDNIGEVLAILYDRTATELRTNPNPRLLKMLLYHHKIYLYGSASESLAESVASLRKMYSLNR